MRKYSFNTEVIVTIFTIFLACTASYFVYDNEIQEYLILYVWITALLVISSIYFHIILEIILNSFKIELSYLRIISPVIFWICSFFLPLYLLVVSSLIGIIIGKKIFNYKIFKICKSNIYIPFLYFIIIGSEAWNMHRSPLPDYYLITQKSTGSDVTFYSALTSIIKTYNICSIGIDGLISFPYHYGTFYFLSNISSKLNLNSVYINHLISPLILLPTSLFIIIKFLNYCRNIVLNYFNKLSNKSIDSKDHIIFIAFLATLSNAPFGLPFVSNLSFFTSPFQIDSQLLANIFLIFILVLTNSFFQNKNQINYITLFLIILFHIILYFTKTTASHLAIFTLLYSLIRYSLQLSFKQNLTWFLTVSICASTTFYFSSGIEQDVINKTGVLTFEFLTLWKDHIPLRELQWIFLSNNFYSFCSLFLLAYLCKDNSSYNVLYKLRDPKYILFELIFILSTLSLLLTGLFGGALSFASTYYLDSMKFISLIFLSAVIIVVFINYNSGDMNLKIFLKNNSLLKSISWICILYLLITGSGLSLKGWSRTLNKYSDSQILESNNNQLTSSKIKLLKTLLRLSKYQNDNSQTCLWIPKSNTLFWHELAEGKNEAFLPFWSVALSEMSLIDGYPISNKLNGQFGYGVYGNKSSLNHEIKLPNIKKNAAMKGFKKLIVLWDDEHYETFTIF